MYVRTGELTFASKVSTMLLVLDLARTKKGQGKVRTRREKRDGRRENISNKRARRVFHLQNSISMHVGCLYHSRVRRSNFFLVDSGSTIAYGMQWKAVSHAAKNGYSHESGMERMSSMKR